MYPERVPREEAVRSIVLSLILTILTCGLYDLYWNAKQMKTMNGLLASGRCISASHDALGSARVMAICMATGQAAGVAAALSAASGRHPRDVDVTDLLESLTRQGAIL